MIPIYKVSPSAINTFDMCQQKWFIQYVLGLKEPAGKAAVLGSCGHYILEAVAKSKILRQNKRKYTNDKILGRIYPKYDINKWIDITYQHFVSENPELNFTKADQNQVNRNITTALAHEMSPENHTEIISSEQFFTIPIDKPWAKTSKLVKGVVQEQQLYVNGIIDIIFRDNNGIINYLDYKFGRPFDWTKKEDKTYSNLVDDIQLCLYYYAVKAKFPSEEIITNIWYITHDKVFVFNFGQETIDFVESRLKDVFEKIRYMEQPLCHYGMHCGFCKFSKENFDFWGASHLNMPYNIGDHFAEKNGMSCVCDSIKTFLKYRGLSLTVENVKGKTK